MIASSPVRLAACLIIAAFIAGCGKKEEAAKAATQVAARVNTEEITVSQINSVLSRNPKIPPEAADKAKREILGKLIDQQLAKQAAIEKKLDRTPAVVQAIEAARDEILARSYLQQVASQQTKPSPETISKYYTEHPELFSERRIFSLEELLVPRTEGLAAKLQAQIAKAKTLQDVVAWLKSQNIKFAANRGVRPAEALPLDMLPKLQTMKDGEIKMIEAAGGLQIFRLDGSKSAPVDLPTAAPRIEQYLNNRSAAEVVAAEMKRLKDKADIAYMGEFAETAESTEAKAKAKTEAAAKAKEQAAAKTKADAEAQARSEELSKARKAAEAKAQAETTTQVEEAAKARRAAEAKARADEEAKAKAAPKGTQLQQENIEKGLRGIK